MVPNTVQKSGQVTRQFTATHVVEAAADPVLCRPCAGAVAPGPEHRRHPPRHPSTGRPAQEGQGSQRRQSPPVPQPETHRRQNSGRPAVPADQPMGTPTPADLGTEPALHLTPGPPGVTPAWPTTRPWTSTSSSPSWRSTSAHPNRRPRSSGRCGTGPPRTNGRRTPCSSSHRSLTPSTTSKAASQSWSLEPRNLNSTDSVASNSR